MMKQLFGTGIVLALIGLIMGLMHFAGVLIGDTLSWVALVLFVVGVVMMIAGSARPARRETRA